MVSPLKKVQMLQNIYAPHPKHAWLSGVVKDITFGKIKLHINDARVATVMLEEPLPAAYHTEGNCLYYTIPEENFYDQILPQAGNREIISENLNALQVLNEATVLDTLRRRFIDGLIYTESGAACVAVNPYKPMPQLYTKEKQDEYLANINSNNGRDAHVYGVSAKAFYHLLNSMTVKRVENGASSKPFRQSIVVSGISGSGKTSTISILINHIASLQSPATGQDNTHSILSKILVVNPILEAFGNAKTVSNTNSSRFGKFVNLEFMNCCETDGDHVELVGSHCKTYLLEKGRIVAQNNKQERSFHIVYQLLDYYSIEDQRSSVSMLSRALRNKTAEDFRFTMKGDTLTKSIEEIYDATAFQNTLIALETVGFDSTLQQQIFEIVSGILYLGEIDFTSIDSTSTTKICCELLGLGVDHQEELFACLSTKTTIIMNETFSSTTDAETSCKYRDALAKDMYRRLFNWLVHSLNEITSINTSAGLDPDARVGFVSLLDIFGFENFTVNHFEQLCINYANEKLQLKFIRDNIATTVEEYKNENLDWMDISFPDNTSVVELIECKRNPNLSNQEKVEKSPSTYSICIIGLLEEECVIPKGSDASFLRKMKSNCRSSASFVPLDKKLNEFAIDHFAARVTYDVTDFVESNRDITPHLSQNLVQSTSNSVLRTLYANSPQHEKAPDPPRNSNNLKSASTVITKFQKQLNELVGVLDNSVVQYVRCIKPNNLQSYDPADFDSPEVVQQLRSSGLIEAIQVSRSAYPYSIPLREFCTKHNPVLKLSDSTKKLLKSSSDHCTTIDCTMLSKLAETIVALSTDGPLTTRDYQIGKSKVFLSEATFQEVEKHTIILLDSLATVVQSKARSLQCRKAYLITLNNISFVQRLLRTKITRYKFLKMKRAARLIQRIYLKRKNDRLEKSVTDIQRIFRGWKGRLCYSKRWNALMILQRLAIRAITKQKSNDLSINLVMVTSDDWSDHSIASDLDLNAIEEMSLPRSDESFLISSDSCVVEVGKSVTFDQELLVLPSFGSGETCAFAPKTTLSFENMQSKLQIETNCSNSMDSEDTMNTVDIHSSIKHSPIKSFGSTCEQYEKKMDHDGWYQSYFSPQDNFWAYAMPSGSEMSALSPFPQCTQNLEPEDFQNIPRGMFSASDDFHISSDSASLAPQHGDHHFSASTNSFNNLQTSTVQQLIRQTQLISQVIRQMTPDTLNSNPTHHRVFTILIEGFVAFIILAMIQYMVLGELWDLMESWKWCDSEMIQYL